MRSWSCNRSLIHLEEEEEEEEKDRFIKISHSNQGRCFLPPLKPELVALIKSKGLRFQSSPEFTASIMNRHTLPVGGPPDAFLPVSHSLPVYWALPVQKTRIDNTGRENTHTHTHTLEFIELNLASLMNAGRVIPVPPGKINWNWITINVSLILQLDSRKIALIQSETNLNSILIKSPL